MLEAYAASVSAKVQIVLKGGDWGIQSALAMVLALLLAMPPRAQGQQPAAVNPAGSTQTPAPGLLPVETLKIFVLEGQGVAHDIHERVASSPVVEVRDDNGLPVEGAEVVFELPALGPGGSFAGQQYRFTIKSNNQGQASATFMPNLETGRFNIKVSATLGNRIGHALVTQTNGLRASTAPPKSGLFKFAWWKVAMVAGAGTIVGVLVATRGGGSGPTVTLIPGSPTFGAP